MEPYLLKKEKYFWKVKFVTYNTKIPLSSVNSSKLLTQFSVSNVWSLLFLLLVSPPSLLVPLTFQSQEKKKKKSTNTTVTTRSVTHPPPPDLSHSLFAISDSLSYQPRPKPWAPPPVLLAVLTSATTTTSIAVTLLSLSLSLCLWFYFFFPCFWLYLGWLGSIWNVKSLTIWLGFEIWALGWFCEKKKKPNNQTEKC